MARRKTTRPTSRSQRGVTPPPPSADNPWPNLQQLIDNDGSISVGHMRPISCAAVANDEHTCYVTLVRRDDESLVELMARLDLALATAIETQSCIDEINPR